MYLYLTFEDRCSLKQPMYCTVSRLDTMFNEEKNVFPLETLLNATENSSSQAENIWSFDSDTLMIYNNKYFEGLLSSRSEF